MGLIDKLIDLPGNAAQAAAEAVVRAPFIPLDVIDKAIEGAEHGFDKALEPPKPK